MRALILSLAITTALPAHAQVTEATDPGPVAVHRQDIVACKTADDFWVFTKEFDPGGAQEMPKGCTFLGEAQIVKRYTDGGAYMALTTDGRRLHLSNVPTTAEGRETVSQNQQLAIHPNLDPRSYLFQRSQ